MFLWSHSNKNTKIFPKRAKISSKQRGKYFSISSSLQVKVISFSIIRRMVKFQLEIKIAVLSIIIKFNRQLCFRVFLQTKDQKVISPSVLTGMLAKEGKAQNPEKGGRDDDFQIFYFMRDILYIIYKHKVYFIRQIFSKFLIKIAMFPRITPQKSQQTPTNEKVSPTKIQDKTFVTLKTQRFKSILPSRCKPKQISPVLELNELKKNKSDIYDYSDSSQRQSYQKLHNQLSYFPKKRMKSTEEEIDQLAHWRQKKIENAMKKKNMEDAQRRLQKSHKMEQMEGELMIVNRNRIKSLGSEPFGAQTARKSYQIESIQSHENRLYPPRRYSRALKQPYTSLSNYKTKPRTRLQESPPKSIRLVTQIIHGQSPDSKSKQNIRLLDEITVNEFREPKSSGYDEKQKEINRLLKYRTYYALNKEEEMKKAEKLNDQKLRETNVFEIDFPKKDKLDQTIKSYVSLIDTIQIPKQIQKRVTKNIIQQYSDEIGKQYFYFGHLNTHNKKREGFGVLATKKSILEGLWINGNIVYGAELQNKFVYKGEFQANQKHGHGKCQWSNGQKYEGQWAFNKRNGSGEWISTQGEVYKGQWVDGKAHGYGVMETKDSGTYRGQFFEYSKTGPGHEKLKNGDEYIGNFKDGIPHGKGIYLWQNGMRYEGDFRDGVRKGNGTQFKPNLFILQSRFLEDYPDGIGSLRVQNQKKTQIKVEKGSIKKYFHEENIKYLSAYE